MIASLFLGLSAADDADETDEQDDRHSVHYTSKTNEWPTPQDLFDELDAEFHFTLDAAATPENAKCDRYFTYIENGLAQQWNGERVWLNPPYGSDLARWVEKAATESADVIAMLVPARTDTRWWSLFWDHETHKPFDGCEVRFLKGRLRFGDGPANAPFPSAIVIFRPNPDLNNTANMPTLPTSK